MSGAEVLDLGRDAIWVTILVAAGWALLAAVGPPSGTMHSMVGSSAFGQIPGVPFGSDGLGVPDQATRAAVEAYNRGVKLTNQGDLKQAIAYFTRAIQLYPRFARAYCDRGLALAMNGDYDRAIADINQAITLSPKNASYYRNRGTLYRL